MRIKPKFEGNGKLFSKFLLLPFFLLGEPGMRLIYALNRRKNALNKRVNIQEKCAYVCMCVFASCMIPIFKSKCVRLLQPIY